MKKFTILLLSSVICLTGFLSSCDNKTNSTIPNSTPTSTKVKEGDVCIDLKIKQMPNKLTYKCGEKFSAVGLIFDAVYQNGYDGDTNLNYSDLDSYSPRGALDSSVTSATITFENFSKEIPITVEEKNLLSVEVSREPDIKSYAIGDSLNLSGLMVKATYEEGTVENETNYYLTDSSGNKYEHGTILKQANSDLELFVNITSNGKTLHDSFHIAISSGITVQAEDNVKSGDTAPIDKSYTVLSGKVEIKKDCTFTGTGYIGSIDKGGQVEFYVYSNSEVKNAKIIFVASSTCQNGSLGKMDDMQFNKCFNVSVEDSLIDIADEVVIKGLEYPQAGSGGNKWTNWADVDVGTINLKKGFNKITLKCIGTVIDSSNYGRTPNIDRLDIRF